MSERFSKRFFVVIACIVLISSTQGSTFLEMYTLLSKLIKNPAQTGEIAPFTGPVGDELSSYVGLGAPGYYLEAGGGLGAVTYRIIQKLRSCDHLDVVEIDPDMCAILKQRFAQYSNVHVHCCSILDWNPEYAYDAIVSTLPLLSLGVTFAQNVMMHFKRMSRVGGVVSCVEYDIVKVARRLVQGVCFNRNTIMRTDVQDFVESVKRQYLKYQKTIYLNLPPVTVYHLIFNTL